MTKTRIQILWGQEATDLLVHHYKSGVTASNSAKIINEKFGTQYTRNAIIGRRDRVGLSRSEPIQSHMARDPLARAALDANRRLKRIERIARLELAEQSRKRKQEIDALKRAEAYAAKLDAIAPMNRFAKSTSDAILSLGFRSCRYPVGAVGADDFHFCCKPRDEDSSYCAHHRAICCIKVPLKLRKSTAL